MIRTTLTTANPGGGKIKYRGTQLDVVLGHRPEGAPNNDRVRKVEGWILGQQP